MQAIKLSQLLALNRVVNLKLHKLYLLLQSYILDDLFYKNSFSKLAINYLFGGCNTAIDWPGIARDINGLAKEGVGFISYFSSKYPKRLREIYNPPLLLFTLGNQELLNKDSIAIVGSRNPGDNAKKYAYEFAYKLVGEGLVVISGLALGVDSRAHLGAINKGKNSTIAVLPCGIDSVYPKKHSLLAKQILEEGGLLVTEYPCRQEIYKSNFPRRNRIITGLSKGVLVIEAAHNSGTMHSAKAAIEQNRSVYVLPFGLDNLNNLAGNQLIRDGALLVDSITNILDDFYIYE